MAQLSLDIQELRRKRRAWYMYDFGNSAYAAVVLLAVYSAYFKGQVVGGAEGSRLWGISVGIAMLVVALISPVLGAIADFSAARKRFLLFFTIVSCLFTALLFFVEKGDVVMGMLFFILAEIGYRGAQVFYNSLLPEIAEPADIGRVSGRGWALGSAGGVICLLIILPLIMIFGGMLIVRLSLVITAVYFGLSSIPLFLRFRELSEPKPLPPGETYLTVGFRQAWETIQHAGSYREFVKLVVAFLIYNDGVMMAMNFASIIGAVLFGMDQTDLIIFVIVVQITNVAGAFVLGHLVDRVGGKRALIASILLMVLSIILMFFATTELFFYFVGALAGFAMAGMQSVSRTMVGLLSPAGQSAEFYGFFAVAGRASSFIGPAVYGGVAYRVAKWYEQTLRWTPLMAERAGQRVAILSIGVFLLLGLALLTSVNERVVRDTGKVSLDNQELAGAD
ncbi:MAG: MFS transporter [Anaerolineae bacterium]|nr:MFS transporter [Anaerolineae bacterium]